MRVIKHKPPPFLHLLQAHTRILKDKVTLMIAVNVDNIKHAVRKSRPGLLRLHTVQMYLVQVYRIQLRYVMDKCRIISSLLIFILWVFFPLSWGVLSH